MLPMFGYSLHLLVCFLLDISHVTRQPFDEKDLEILFLRQPLALGRRHKRGPTLSPLENLLFATLVAKLKRAEPPIHEQLGRVLRWFQPETVRRWHRDLVRNKWTYSSSSRNRGGRLKTDAELEALVVRLPCENGRGGASCRVSGSSWALTSAKPPSVTSYVGIGFPLPRSASRARPRGAAS
jgi:hypothetical protein